jgi:hypothetical protein
MSIESLCIQNLQAHVQVPHGKEREEFFQHKPDEGRVWSTRRQTVSYSGHSVTQSMTENDRLLRPETSIGFLKDTESPGTHATSGQPLEVAIKSLASDELNCWPGLQARQPTCWRI